MNKRGPLHHQDGFSLISIVLVLLLIAFFAVRELPRYFDMDEDVNKLEKTHPPGSQTKSTPTVRAISEEAKDRAGEAALAAAASNVQMAYARLLVNHPSGKAVTNADVVQILNSSHTAVGDYIVAYSTSGKDKIRVALQKSSKGKFGTPDTKEVAFR